MNITSTFKTGRHPYVSPQCETVHLSSDSAIMAVSTAASVEDLKVDENVYQW